ncbi:MAG: hypothetical protein ABGX25_06120 [Nautiliaceae bacterium]
MIRIFFIFLLLFVGCSKNIYIHWNIEKESQVYETNKTVAVKIELPDYMLSGNIAGVKGGKIILLDYKINEIPEDFFEKYTVEKLKNLTGFKVCSLWDTENFNVLVDIKILDYYVDFDKKEVVLKAEVFDKKFKRIINFKGDFLKAYQEAYDELLNFIAIKLKEKL